MTPEEFEEKLREVLRMSRLRKELWEAMKRETGPLLKLVRARNPEQLCHHSGARWGISPVREWEPDDEERPVRVLTLIWDCPMGKTGCSKQKSEKKIKVSSLFD